MRVAKIELDNGVIFSISDHQLPLTIGRAIECDIRICEPYVSRRHCELFMDSSQSLWLKDLSSNGTTIDNETVFGEAVRLSNRTHVDIAGEQQLTVTLTDDDGITRVPGI